MHVVTGSAESLQFARLPRQQRHEAHRDQVLARDARLSVLVSLTMCCVPSCGPSGSTIMPPSASCVDQRLRHVFGRGGDDDAVERRALRRAGKAVADDDLDVVVAERLRAASRAASASVR